LTRGVAAARLRLRRRATRIVIERRRRFRSGSGSLALRAAAKLNAAVTEHGGVAKLDVQKHEMTARLDPWFGACCRARMRIYS